MTTVLEKLAAVDAAPLPFIAVGFDTARYGHRVTFLRPDRQPAAPRITVTENDAGYQQLRQTFEALHRKHPQARFTVRIDAAGQYATNLERRLRLWDTLPLDISVGEPTRNKNYHKSVSPKRKTDDTESYAMARFAVAEQPAPTPAVPEEHYLLREIASRLQAAVKDTTRAVNRLHNLYARVFPEFSTIMSDFTRLYVLSLLKKYPTPQRLAAASLKVLKQRRYLKPQVAEQLHAAAQHTVGSLSGAGVEALVRHLVEHLETCVRNVKSLEKLLESAMDALPASGHRQVETIPGIGKKTAAVLVAKMISIERFASPEHLVGYFGVFPEENSSGVDRQGQPIPPGAMHMSAKGCDLVRKYVWNAANSAIQCNPAVKALYARLRARGTRGDVALGHCMRKLLHQVYGVWASDKPYNELASLGYKAKAAAEDAAAQDAIADAAAAPPTQQPIPPATTANSPTAALVADALPAVETTAVADAIPAAETITAAGHKRVNPQEEVVTAATSSVAPRCEVVKDPAPAKDPSPVTKSAARRAGSIDYAYLRQQITMEEVLRRLRWLSGLCRTGHEYRGPCPFHTAGREKSRSFCVNLKKQVFRCCDPHCQVQGNVLDLWAAAHKLPLYEAALHLAETFHLYTTR